jgi:hypothetical protein
MVGGEGLNTRAEITRKEKMIDVYIPNESSTLLPPFSPILLTLHHYVLPRTSLLLALPPDRVHTCLNLQKLDKFTAVFIALTHSVEGLVE